MTEEQDRAIRRRITALSFGVIVLMLVFMVALAVTGKVGTILFPAGLAMLLAVYWTVADVLPVVWRKIFDGRTDAQKKAYYRYALIDAIGYAGLVYFVVNMTSMTGALVYAASIFLKRRFWDEFQGTGGENADDAEDTDAAENADTVDTAGAVEDADTVDTAGAVEDAGAADTAGAVENADTVDTAGAVEDAGAVGDADAVK